MNQRIEQALATLREIEAAMSNDTARSYPGRIAHAVAIYCAQLEKEVMSSGTVTVPTNASVGAASTENTRPIAEVEVRGEYAPYAIVTVCGVDTWCYVSKETATSMCAAINAAYHKRREEDK
jgi:hypothetical protein